MTACVLRTWYVYGIRREAGVRKGRRRRSRTSYLPTATVHAVLIRRVIRYVDRNGMDGMEWDRMGWNGWMGTDENGCDKDSASSGFGVKSHSLDCAKGANGDLQHRADGGVTGLTARGH